LYECDRVEENIKLINLLRPSIKNQYYLAVRSMTSELIRQRVTVEMEKFPQINFVEIRDESLSEAAELLLRGRGQHLTMPCVNSCLII
jgi:hypothetical protein